MGLKGEFRYADAFDECFISDALNLNNAIFGNDNAAGKYILMVMKLKT